MHDREYGQTFAPADIAWIDFESRSSTDIKAGAYRYATEADAIVLAGQNNGIRLGGVAVGTGLDVGTTSRLKINPRNVCGCEGLAVLPIVHLKWPISTSLTGFIARQG